MSPATIDKAQRLSASGRVLWLAWDVARVIGDHDAYLVRHLRADLWLCTCPAFGTCSHILAVAIATDTQPGQDEVNGRCWECGVFVPGQLACATYRLSGGKRVEHFVCRDGSGCCPFPKF
jgi:hypothetical protein